MNVTMSEAAVPVRFSSIRCKKADPEPHTVLSSRVESPHRNGFPRRADDQPQTTDTTQTARPTPESPARTRQKNTDTMRPASNTRTARATVGWRTLALGRGEAEAGRKAVDGGGRVGGGIVDGGGRGRGARSVACAWSASDVSTSQMFVGQVSKFGNGCKRDS